MKTFKDYLFEAKYGSTLGRAKKYYSEFNESLFDGSLPEIDVVRKNTNLKAGAFTFGSYGHQKVEYISINPFIEFDDSTLKAIILHEMVHVYLMANGIKERDSHGRRFKKEVDRINRLTGGIYNVPYKHFDIFDPKLELNFPELKTPRLVIISKGSKEPVLMQLNMKAVIKNQKAMYELDFRLKHKYKEVRYYRSKAGFLKVMTSNRTLNKVHGMMIDQKFIQQEIIPKSTEIEYDDIKFWS